MFDPDLWRVRGVHWHAYAETADSDRDERRERCPDVVLTSPDEVADWIARLTERHIQRRPVRLIEPREWAELGDRESIEHDKDSNHEVACRGDSLAVDIPRQFGRLYLYAEAVTVDECPDGHGQEDRPP